MATIVYRAGSRDRFNWKRFVVLVAASTLGAATTGLIFGLLGYLLPSNLRWAIVLVISGWLVGAAAWELAGRRAKMLQIDIETPYDWTKLNSVTWSIKNGFALGFALKTRIGFPLWYALPVCAIALGSVPYAVGMFATYGFFRCFFGLPLGLKALRTGTVEIGDALSRRYPLVRRVAAAGLLMIASVLLVTALTVF